jgi:hypothetical protein
VNRILWVCALVFSCLSPTFSQQAAPLAPAESGVPRLVSFGGTLHDPSGKLQTGIVGITFAIYKDQHEGAPLWLETQNVEADKSGHYTVQLGSSQRDGLPRDLFASGEARWLGVQVGGQAEQPRVLLLSVPYALKAADAETVGGLPPSAFVLAAPSVHGGAPGSNDANVVVAAPSAVPLASTVTTTGGTVNAIPLFTTGTNIQNSILTQSATSAINVGGKLNLLATGTATASGGKNSQPEVMVASVFNSGTSTAVPQKFEWQAEPVNNDKTTASGTLNLLYGSGTAAPAETGMKINNKGQITFAPGQTFPGIGSGTVKRVGLSAPASDFIVSGSPITGSGTLGLSWTVTPSSSNTAGAIVKRDSSGSFSAGNVTVSGLFSASTSAADAAAVTGTSSGSDGIGVEGFSADNAAVLGYGRVGVSGTGTVVGADFVGAVAGVEGVGSADGSYGVFGQGHAYGVFGKGYAAAVGVWGESEMSDGLHGVSHGSKAAGVAALNDAGGDAILAAVTNGGVAGSFFGNVEIVGNLSKSGGSFKIDHPLDPADKYLYHSFVESPDMMNIYNGNVTTDAQGNAIVTMPDWFEALNRDFRYQLTVIGTFAQAIVATEIANGSFTIKTDKPNVKVSWQVTGVRQDAWANAHRIPIEQVKPEKERGFYLHPELFGAPEERGIAWARHPETMKRAKEKSPQPPLFTKH